MGRRAHRLLSSTSTAAATATTPDANNMCVPPTPPSSVVAQCDYAVEVDNLDFAYPSSLPGEDEHLVLKNFCMQLKPGSRCLLLGANGSGKSTLLKVLAGKHLTKGDRVKVMGTDAFRDLKLNLTRAFLDTQWGMRTVAFAGYGCPL